MAGLAAQPALDQPGQQLHQTVDTLRLARPARCRQQCVPHRLRAASEARGLRAGCTRPQHRHHPVRCAAEHRLRQPERPHDRLLADLGQHSEATTRSTGPVLGGSTFSLRQQRRRSEAASRSRFVSVGYVSPASRRAQQLSYPRSAAGSRGPCGSAPCGTRSPGPARNTWRTTQVRPSPATQVVHRSLRDFFAVGREPALDLVELRHRRNPRRVRPALFAIRPQSLLTSVHAPVSSSGSHSVRSCGPFIGDCRDPIANHDQEQEPSTLR